MDLNQLFFNHQFALMSADHTPSDDVRQMHLDRAGHYAGRIREFREGLDLPIYSWSARRGERRGEPYPKRANG